MIVSGISSNPLSVGDILLHGYSAEIQNHSRVSVSTGNEGDRAKRSMLEKSKTLNPRMMREASEKRETRGEGDNGVQFLANVPTCRSRDTR